MTPMRVPLALVVLASLFLAACGGGGSGLPDVSSVPTATPPAELPEPIIIGEMAPVGEPETYVVEPGDSLYAIAEKLGVDPDEIARLNELADVSSLEVGQVLKIPGAPPAVPTGPGSLPAEQPATPAPAPTGEDTYTIQSGDNASAIADACGFTLDDLAAANGTTIEGLRSLEVGQVLSLPGPCVVPETAPEAAPETPEVVPPPEAATPEVAPPTEAATPEVAPEAPTTPPEGVEPAPEAPTPSPEPGTEGVTPTASP
jgi:LysM repeat protein